MSDIHNSLSPLLLLSHWRASLLLNLSRRQGSASYCCCLKTRALEA